jgi:hypothetical protein
MSGNLFMIDKPRDDIMPRSSLDCFGFVFWYTYKSVNYELLVTSIRKADDIIVEKATQSYKPRRGDR